MGAHGADTDLVVDHIHAPHAVQTDPVQTLLAGFVDRVQPGAGILLLTTIQGSGFCRFSLISIERRHRDDLLLGLLLLLRDEFKLVQHLLMIRLGQDVESGLDVLVRLLHHRLIVIVVVIRSLCGAVVLGVGFKLLGQNSLDTEEEETSGAHGCRNGSYHNLVLQAPGCLFCLAVSCCLLGI